MNISKLIAVGCFIVPILSIFTVGDLLPEEMRNKQYYVLLGLWIMGVYLWVKY